ncbi:PLP-dependent aminotransferase family protein [Roseovarius sp. CAU 1744]|uniref:MocR-like pyridoxine biosynthesis transcription factor PdxR n=1 Tax=Roseovarius sp. CAU 1744 TaxID=3140368 RepID=UPI00325AF311
MAKYVGGALIPTLSIDRGDRATITVQLVSALRELILSGQLRAGERLPASRTLARDQGVSRTTAINAYEQLTAEGLLRSQVGSGTFVSDAIPTPAPKDEAETEPGGTMPRLAHLSAEASDQYFPRLSHPDTPRAFVTGMPAFDVFPMALWSRLASRYWRSPRSLVMSYPDPCGLLELRQAVCQHLRANRGVKCAPEEVFIFNGAQDAFNRIGGMLLDPGDPVWFENPGAIGARNSLISCGAQLVPVPVDDQGMDVRAGLDAAPGFRLAFVTPAHQHPLGTTMTTDRRFELLRAAENARAWIIEDDYVGEFHYGAHTPLPLKSIDTSGRVIYVGTFSKALFPALRLGYAVAPPKLVPFFQRIAGATMQGAPASMQSIVADFINEGHFAAHIRRMRDIYAERRDALLSEADRTLNGLLKVRPTDTGFHTIGDLTHPGLSDVTVSQAARQAGISAAPLSRFTIQPVPRQAITLGFSAVPPAQIVKGVQALAPVLREAMKAA